MTTCVACSGSIAPRGGANDDADRPGIGDGDDRPVTPDDGNPHDDDGTPNTPGPTCDRTAVGPGTGRAVRLSGQQYLRSATAFIGGPEAQSLPARGAESTGVLDVRAPFSVVNENDRFTTNARSYSVDKAVLEDVFSSARNIAARFWQAEADAGGCLADASADLATCLRTVLNARGPILFHRPLTETELDQYVGVATAILPEVGRETAARAAVEAMLVAPQFLFRREIGAASDQSDVHTLSDFEIAAALSYMLTDGPPDAELWSAAANGQLHTRDAIAAQVERLMATPGTLTPATRFVEELFQYGAVAGIDKPDEFAGHAPDALLDDTRRLTRKLLDGAGDGDFVRALLTTRTGYVRSSTAESYGVPDPGSDTPVATTFTGDRIGLMAQPSWLVAKSALEENDPIRRGRFVFESLLCNELPDVAITEFPPVEHTDETTLREELVMHRSKPSCNACHQFMDPMGLVFEGFDHFGRPRENETGRPVDTSGEILGSEDVDGPVAGPVELVNKLAGSATVHRCFVKQAFTYWMGREPDERDACTLEDALEASSEAGDFHALVGALFSSRPFLDRMAPGGPQ